MSKPEKVLFILSCIGIFLLILTIYAVRTCLGFERIPILMYHQVRSDKTGDLYINPEMFRGHLNWLKEHGYETITFSDVYNGVPLPKKPIILTFDDGTQGHWDVFHELSRQGMRGVFFVMPSYWQSAYYLKAWQVERMSQCGMEIGSHTMTHPYLTKLEDKELWWELFESKARIEKLTKKHCKVIAYPYGAYNKKVIETVEKVGYHYGRTVNEAITEWGYEKNFRLPKITLGEGLK